MYTQASPPSFYGTHMTIDITMVSKAFDLRPRETETLEKCIILANGLLLPSLAKRLTGMGMSHPSMRVNALKHKGILEHDENAGFGHWKFSDKACRELKNAGGENGKIAPPAGEQGAPQVSEVFARMVYDFLVTKIDKDKQVVLSDTFLSELCSNFSMSMPNILATLGKLEEMGLLVRNPRRTEDKGIRLLVNGTGCVPPAPSLVPSTLSPPAHMLQVVEQVQLHGHHNSTNVDPVDALTSQATTIAKMLQYEIRQAEEIIREGECRKNRARELLHAIRDFMET